jgi:hypothetical protein
MTNASFATVIGCLLLLIAVASWQFWTLTASDNLAGASMAVTTAPN